MGTAVGPAQTGLCWGEDNGSGKKAGEVGEFGGNWAGLGSTWERKPSVYNSCCVTMQGEDSQQGVCSAEPGLMEGLEDMRVQEKEDGLCPWWHEQTRKVAQRPLSPLSHWLFVTARFQHWLLTAGFWVSFVVKTSPPSCWATLLA